MKGIGRDEKGGRGGEGMKVMERRGHRKREGGVTEGGMGERETMSL